MHALGEELNLTSEEIDKYIEKYGHMTKSAKAATLSKNF
jgi:hypothetical protein